MQYSRKIAEGPVIPAQNTPAKDETPPNPNGVEKPEGWRNPWRGAAVGGTLGGLLTASLGYLYGHRGRWLAYDAIAGTAGGGTLGYVVDSSNNKDVRQREEGKTYSPYTLAGHQKAVEISEKKKQADWDEKHKQWLEIQKAGGFATDPNKVGLVRAFLNHLAKAQFTQTGAHLGSREEAEKYVADREKKSAVYARLF